ncbi:hypothetical protein SteCoe_25495 [Stentor coeruleus]|uniref:Uncharacterized protein n=1 Tax=Stentor coeruleus TaxID=5963 RepID=A0A1R2BF20_9CILI|nr:hypothetical protein SteCoe_25495 [Stentor coeruleus]
MDIRDEEFLKKKQEFLRKKQAEEISAKNIINAINQTEEMRNKVYSNANIGGQGNAMVLGFLSTCFCLFTMTKRFKHYFPKGYEFFSQTHMIKVIVILVSFKIGLIFEQKLYERGGDPIGTKDYMSMFDYTESLKRKRLDSLSYAERFRIVTDYDFEKYAKIVKEYFSSSKS